MVVTQKKAGFTLVELIIVVALIGIVIGIILTQMIILPILDYLLTGRWWIYDLLKD